MAKVVDKLKINEVAGVFHTGDVFKCVRDGKMYILVYSGSGYNLVNLYSGNRFTEDKDTVEELIKYIGKWHMGNFKYIKDCVMTIEGVTVEI